MHFLEKRKEKRKKDKNREERQCLPETAPKNTNNKGFLLVYDTNRIIHYMHVWDSDFPPRGKDSRSYFTIPHGYITNDYFSRTNLL